MRKLIYYVACTADGFIAKSDGSYDCFLNEGEHLADLAKEFPETFPVHMHAHFGVRLDKTRFDTVLMGRGTYDAGYKFGIASPYPHLKQFVFSRSMTSTPSADVELVRDHTVETVSDLKRHVGKDIWLCGGGDLATQLAPLIDELILKVNPVVIGAGIPLFRGAIDPLKLSVLTRKVYASGYERVHYAVAR